MPREAAESPSLELFLKTWSISIYQETLMPQLYLP